MLKYPLFLCDFDGTLVRADGSISQKNAEAIARYREAGGTFIVCTGRVLSAILPRLDEAGIKEGLVAALQGSVIADIATGKVFKYAHFPAEEGLAIVNELVSRSLHVHVYEKDEFYCNKDDEALALYEKICKVKAIVAPDLTKTVREKNVKIVKILVMCRPNDGLYEELLRLYGEKYFVTRSAPFLVELLPKGENKGAAAEFLSSYYHVPLERMAAIGDENNDLSMIEKVGGKFTPASGDPALQAIATVVAPCEEDGVAEALSYAIGERE